LALQVRDVRLRLVFDPHKEAAKWAVSQSSPAPRDRLPAEHDLVVIERAVWRALLRRDIVPVGLVRVGHWGAVLMGENVEHAADAQRRAGIDASDASSRNRRIDDITMGKAGKLYSATYLASPVTLARPSIRDVAVPI